MSAYNRAIEAMNLGFHLHPDRRRAMLNAALAILGPEITKVAGADAGWRAVPWPAILAQLKAER